MAESNPDAIAKIWIDPVEGLSEQAARDFLFGHLRIELAIIFDVAGFPFSDGALLAIERAKEKIFRPNWKNVMSLDSIQQSVKEITHAN